MSGSDWLTDPASLGVADASLLINLNATGRAAELMSGLPCRFAVPEQVFAELEQGRSAGHEDADALAELCDRGLVQRLVPGEAGLRIFTDLVSGAAPQTLDDGEAATIGCAVAQSGVALLDERKARKLCATRFPELELMFTVELLLSWPVRELLGAGGQTDAVFKALLGARMACPGKLAGRVRRLLGPAKAGLCTSLPQG